jgi:hypothetical protein
MAMTMKVEGMEEISRILTELGNKAPEVAAQSLYEGAGVMGDAFRQAANSIRAKRLKYPAPEGKKRLPSVEEKAAVVRAVGIAKFQKDGNEVDTIVGVGGSAGYADIAGHRKAVRLIARSINSGTSFMDKQPVFRQAKTKSQKTAAQAIVDKAEQMFNDITGTK